MLSKILLLVSLTASTAMAVPTVPPGGTDNLLSGKLLLTEANSSNVFANRFALVPDGTSTQVEIASGPLTLGALLQLDQALTAAAGHEVQVQGGYETDSSGNTF